MRNEKHYTPPLKRFLVTALYHQAKLEHVPMTLLVNRIVQQSLEGGAGWKQAVEQYASGPILPPAQLAA